MNNKLTSSAIVLSALILLTANMPFVIASDGSTEPACLDESTSDTTPCPLDPRLATPEEGYIDRNGNGYVIEIKLDSCRDSNSPCTIVIDDIDKFE